MAGQITRKMYDGCAFLQDVHQSTDPLTHQMDINKYVHHTFGCKSPLNVDRNGIYLVDIDSSLRGIDKTASRCDGAKYPFCSSSGCLLTADPRIGQHNSPYVLERGQVGDKTAVVSTNQEMPTHPGYNIPHPNVCQGQSTYAGPQSPLGPQSPQGSQVPSLAHMGTVPSFDGRLTAPLSQVQSYDVDAIRQNAPWAQWAQRSPGVPIDQSAPVVPDIHQIQQARDNLQLSHDLAGQFAPVANQIHNVVGQYAPAFHQAQQAISQYAPAYHHAQQAISQYAPAFHQAQQAINQHAPTIQNVSNQIQTAPIIQKIRQFLSGQHQ